MNSGSSNPLKTGFIPLALADGPLAALPEAAVWGVNGGTVEVGAGTWFGMIVDGPTELHTDIGQFPLRAGMHFSWPGPLAVCGGRALLVGVPGYRGSAQLGGPIGPKGRLVYIDGCSDTLLVCPPRLGEPCLNHLHLPAGTDQSAHTHPSVRIGVIARGSGWCRTGDGARVRLEPGLGWVIPTGSLHSFVTDDEALDVFAWHPDSDFGPTDQDHPMINRTILSPAPEGAGGSSRP